MGKRRISFDFAYPMEKLRNDREKNCRENGIQYSTLREWKKASPSIHEALESGTEELAQQIASSMVKKAKGYDYTEKKNNLTGEVKQKRHCY